MKLFAQFIFVFVSAFSFISAENLPKYRMVDLGLFGTDQSSPIAINENGQILGRYEECGLSSIFLWDEINGLKILDQPIGTNSWNLKFNNNGQVAGINSSDSMSRIFYWDPNLGFWELDSSKNGLDLAAFNDKGQVLGKIGDQIFIWDHGKKTNLTTLFLERFTGKWQSFHPKFLNNHGHVTFSVYKKQEVGNDTWGTRSFLWIDGSFKMIMPEKDWETQVEASCLDDDGNMIVYIHPRNNNGLNGYYFISPLHNIFAYCDGCNLLRNGLPIARDCLPGKLKIDKQGKFYYSQGLQIKKLFNEEFPYYNIANTTEIRDQNSKGYVIGTIDTMFPGNHHAFLAIPEAQINDD